MTRLVIVSNRLSLPGSSTQAGGLAVAMREALKERGGLWFGWSGETAEEPDAAPRLVSKGNVTYAAVDLTPDEHRLYYLGFANGTLWPLLHLRLGLMEYRREAARAYGEVNRRFAAMLAPLLRPDDLIWVHDYHLFPLGEELRKLGVKSRIGFFLHTPFPPAEILIALPRHEALLASLSFYDLVGMQTEDCVRAFLHCIVDVAGGVEQADGVYEVRGQTGRVAAFPIGIDTEGFMSLAQRAEHSAETRRLDESLAGRPLVLGIDRLDYSKGIPQRFDAMDALLTDWPEHRRQFNYLQITPHSRGEVAQYRALRREIEGLAGRVNGKFAEFDWSPIRYLNRSFSRPTLAGFLRRSRIGLVTPLRDGMNLVAKEFVAAQNPQDPGVLVLSRFAGAARELTTALLVNPIDIDATAAALHRGLIMPREERIERWSAMMTIIQRNTIDTWRSDFLATLAATPLAGAQPPLRLSA